ncbi:MAG: hypothetical protein N838_21935 [Thiohalocapsa sp. PB-PSB1]|nr:MAG: hypothetical protein N838_21935 [Thiohalocapsa sp. PB-PSB1]
MFGRIGEWLDRLRLPAVTLRQLSIYRLILALAWLWAALLRF